MSKEHFKDDIRLRLCQQFIDTNLQEPILERALLRQFSGPRQKKAIEELSLLLSEGFLNRLGTGRRNNPFRITRSGSQPINRCPYCHHESFKEESDVSK